MTHYRKCLCGHELPMHLVGFGLSSHVCACGRKYAPGEGTKGFILVGEETNPSASVDLALMTPEELLEYKSRMYDSRRNGTKAEACLVPPTQDEYDLLMDYAHFAWNDDHEANVNIIYGAKTLQDKNGITRGVTIWVKQLKAGPRSSVQWALEMSGTDKISVMETMRRALISLAGKRHAMPVREARRLQEWMTAKRVRG